MPKAKYITTLATVAGFASQTVAADLLVDQPAFSKKVADYITSQCPQNNQEARDKRKVTECIAAGADMSNSIANAMTTYINKNLTDKLLLGSEGAAVGDLIQFCSVPFQQISGKQYSTMKDYLDAAFNAVASCEQSMVRAGKEVGIDFQPTARNTVSCHMNKLKGVGCQY